MKSVLLADDHPIFRAGLRHIIETDPEFSIVAEVGDGDACIAQANILKPNIIVTDLSMPGKNGFEISSWAANNLPDTRTIIVSMHSSKDYIQQGIESGAYAFIAKEDTSNDLLAAIKSSGPFTMSASAGTKTVQPGSDLAFDIQQNVQRLTKSERIVLQLIAQGDTSPKIAQKLGSSPRTVQTHRQNMATKLDLKGPNSLIGFAIKNRQFIARL